MARLGDKSDSGEVGRGREHIALPRNQCPAKRRIQEVFLRQFLPGLFAVLRGNLYLVGLPPRTVEEIEALPKDWRALYVAVKSGLITEAGTASTDLEDNMQLYLADAYYSVRRTWSYDLVLAARYFSRLVMPRQNSGRRLSVKPSDFHNERESLETK